MWEVNLYKEKFYGYTTLGSIVTRFPEDNSLPHREKIAEKHGFYTKPEECSHTFFFMYNGEELKVKFQYNGICENIMTEKERVRKTRLYGRRDTKIHNYLSSDEELQEKLWFFMWDMFKHRP